MSAPRSNDRQPASTVALQIVQAAVRQDVTLPELGRMASSDPAFGMRVLSLVNSPGFALASRVSDVNQAVNLLGIRGLRNLALSLAVSDMTPSGPDGELLLANAIRRAVAAKKLAEAVGERKADSFFTTGLFLEAGMLVEAKTNLQGVADIARSPALARVIRERAAWGEDHPTVGGTLAEDFSLPDETVQAIRHHHDAEPPPARMALVAWVAERVAGVFEGGDLTRNREEAFSAAKHLGISDKGLQPILEELPQLVTSAASGFQRRVGNQRELGSLLEDATRELAQLNLNYESTLRQLEKAFQEKERLAKELQVANKRLAQLAHTDPLTKLPNKRAFDDNFARELARSQRQNQPIGVMMLDVDRFKSFNDTYGHQTGDLVLQEVGRMLRKWLRTSDFAARYGGEEFVALLPNTDAAGAKIVGERIREKLAENVVSTEHGPLQVTASFGIAIERSNFKDGAAILKRADDALYAAKDAGRNRVIISE